MEPRLCYNPFRCSSNKSPTILLPCGSTVDSPWRIKADFPFGQSHSCEGPTRPSAGGEYYPCHWYLAHCCLMLGMSPRRPRLIYHSNCEWRTGTVEEQRKAAPTLPSLTIYLVICAKAVPSAENRDLVFGGSRWAKTTQHTPLRLSIETAIKAKRIFWCMQAFCVKTIKM